ncbi:MAG: alginate lyase family protein [Blastocatellia bacterium]
MQLSKLRGRSIKELTVRGRQELAKFGERFLNPGSKEMSDAQFLRETNWEPSDLSAARIRSGFFPSLSARESIITMMERQFPDERRLMIARADRAIDGSFDLLGLSDISFGNPIDWRLEPVSGRRTKLDHWSRIDYLNPDVAGDKKVTWELNRHAHFVTFGQAYQMTGDEKYATAFVSQATAWMDTNPVGSGINWASSLEAAFRSIAWLWALQLFSRSRELTPRFTLRFLKCLIAHGRHIESYLSHYFSPNTHLTGEALALFYLGTTFGDLKRAALWRETGIRILLEQLPRQVLDDGVYFEQSTYYHRYTVDFYLHLLILARANNLELPEQVEEKLVRMLDHLMWITRPDNTSPFIGDDDGGRLIKLGERRPDDFRDTLGIGAALFGRSDWKFVAGHATVEMLWLLGPKAVSSYERIRSEPHGEVSRAFNASGYYVLRDGWSRDSSYAVIDCGPHGALACGHAHSDALAFEYAALGKTWLVDPGTYSYTGDPKSRDEFRGTGAHNTVSVDDEPQSIPASSFSWSKIARASMSDFIAGDGFDYFEGLHNGYERLSDPVSHKRAIFFVKPESLFSSAGHLPSYMTVRDSFTASASHRYTIRYHLSPGCSVMANGNRVIVSEPDGGRLNISVFGDSTARARIARGWVSRAYGHRIRSLVAVFEAEGEGPQQFTTFIVPSASGQPVHIEQKATDDPLARGFHIATEKSLDVVLLGNGSTVARCGPLTSDGLMAWGRFINNEFERACLVRGRKLETSDGVRLNASSSLRQCVIERFGNWIEVSSGSANWFGSDQSARLTIKGATFCLERGWQMARFANDGSGWKISNAS